MTLSVSCKDLGTEWCDFVAYSETLDEIQTHFVEHGREAHDIDEEQMRSAEATAMMHAMAHEL